MSVVFSAVMNVNVPYRIECFCGAINTGEVYPDYVSAYTQFKILNPVCSDPYCYADVSPADAEPEVQLSNSNAAVLLDVLGITVGKDWHERCTGSMGAEDLLGRILIAEAIAPISAEVPAFAEGNIIWGGRQEGYIQSKLEGLKNVALFGFQHNRNITWG